MPQGRFGFQPVVGARVESRRGKRLQFCSAPVGNSQEVLGRRGRAKGAAAPPPKELEAPLTAHQDGFEEEAQNRRGQCLRRGCDKVQGAVPSRCGPEDRRLGCLGHRANGSAEPLQGVRVEQQALTPRVAPREAGSRRSGKNVAPALPGLVGLITCQVMFVHGRLLYQIDPPLTL